MLTIPELHVEHRALLARANELLALVSQPEPPTLEALVALRWTLVTEADSHYAREQKLVEDELGHSGDKIARSLAKRYSSELLDLRLAVSAHAGRWNNVLVQKDLAGYREAVREHLGLMVKRMVWEEKIIFPTIEMLRLKRAEALAW